MENLNEGKLAAGRKGSQERLAIALIFVVFLAGAVLVALDWREFAPVLAQADGRPLLGALALTLLSYGCVGSAFAFVSRLLGIRMSLRALAEIGFVSVILNHVLTTGGVAGYSVRYFLMRRHGVALADVLSASILHIYLTSLDMLLMLPVGFLYLFLNADLPNSVTALVGLMVLVMSILAVVATGLIFLDERRSQLARGLTRVVRRFLHRDIEETLQRFEASLARGVTAMRKQPFTVVWVMSLTWIDWFASVGVVWLCFDALGEPVRFGVVLAGYVIGVMAGVLSMVPGGLGV